MTAAVECRACGAINRIGRRFCVRCGQALNSADIRPPSGGGARRVVRTIRILVFLALLAALVLMVRSVPSGGQPGSNETGMECARRMNQLQALAQAGRPGEERFTEEEVNGYLQHLLTNSPNRMTSGIVRAELESFRVQFLDGEAVLVWVVRLGSLPLTYEVTGRPVVGAQGFALESPRVRAGHLPLPGKLGDWAAANLFKVFENLSREKLLLDSLAEVRAETRAVVARCGDVR